MKAKDGGFGAAGFFALRTPLLPFEEFSRWTDGLETPACEDVGELERAVASDRDLLRARLRAALQRPEVTEAIFIASPSLSDGIAAWLDDPDSDRGRKVERSLVRYFVRMTTRPTPFGLFAGCSTGRMGKTTRLEIGGLSQYRRHTRPDMDYLTALVEALESDHEVRRELVFRPNSSLYPAAGRLRYAESSIEPKIRSRSYRLVALEESDYLISTLRLAEKGAVVDELAKALIDDEVSLEEAEEFIHELIDSQVLESDLAPPVTGGDPLDFLAQRLETVHAVASGVLREAGARLDKLDSQGIGAGPSEYQDLAALLGDLPAEVQISRLFQVDMTKPSPNATLGRAVLDEIEKAVRFLHRLGDSGREDPMAEFRRKFTERYGDREVPFADVLDEESGIGFAASTAPEAEAAPLLEGLAFPDATDQRMPWPPRHTLVVKKAMDALVRGDTEITFLASELESLPEPASDLPDSFAVMAAVAASSSEACDRGDFLLLIDGVSGPPGARLLGRFCHTDPELRESVSDLGRREEALRPGALFAEVVHLPEGRVGNVIHRPVLRDHEIGFLGRPGADPDKQIPVTDLLVSVRGDRIVLRSKRLGREVVGRMSCAHNFTFRSLGTYRFLCTLQQQGVAGALTWDWGPLMNAPYLPRVRVGKSVLSRARWLVTKDEIAPMARLEGADLIRAIRVWRRDRRIPRLVALSDFDNELIVDLENVLAAESLFSTIRNRPDTRFVEVFPGPDDLPASGPEGRFAHEVVVPFLRAREASPAAAPAAAPTIRRSFPPGSEWLYVKLYAGTATADQVLKEMAPLIDGVDRRWFFVRYSDPDPHLRLRIRDDPDRLRNEVLPVLSATTSRLMEAGLVWRMQLDTYEREVERYGGDDAIEVAEEIFHADSEAVLRIVELLSGDEGADARWRLALKGAEDLMADFGLDSERRRSLVRKIRDGYALEFRVDSAFRKKMGENFEKERASLEELLKWRRGSDHELSPGLEVLAERSERVAPCGRRLLDLSESGRLVAPIEDLLAAFIHMHLNRVLRSAQRAQEAVIYHYLDKLHLAAAARTR